MCDCIEKIEKRVKKEHGAYAARMRNNGWSEIQYTPITLKGERAKHNRQEGKITYITHSIGEQVKVNLEGK